MCVSYGWSKKSLWLFWNIQDSVKPDLVCTERFDSGTLDLTAVDSTYPTHMLSDVVHQRCRHQSIIWGSACLNVDRKLYPECIIIIIHSFIHPFNQTALYLHIHPLIDVLFDCRHQRPLRLKTENAGIVFIRRKWSHMSDSCWNKLLQFFDISDMY